MERSRNNGSTVFAGDLLGKFEYSTRDHAAIIFSANGSIWQFVFPFCLMNSILTALVIYCRDQGIIDLTFNSQGHQYMSTLVSFLVVTRLNIAYQRFCQIASSLKAMMSVSRELVQNSVALSRFDKGPNAQKWRSEIAREIITLLRAIVYIFRTGCRCHIRDKDILHILDGKINERSPNIFVIFLRSTIVSHVEKLKRPLEVVEELLLLSHVEDFFAAYHEVMKVLISPFPFPLVQMSRTLLFIWVFTLPFALVYEMDTVVGTIMTVFFITFGFLGLEFISIFLDDPFGQDPIDFDVLSMTEVTFDDIFINIHDVDGQDAEEKLITATKSKLSQRIKKEVRGHARAFSNVIAWVEAAAKFSSAKNDVASVDEISKSIPPDDYSAETFKSYQNKIF